MMKSVHLIWVFYSGFFGGGFESYAQFNFNTLSGLYKDYQERSKKCEGKKQNRVFLEKSKRKSCYSKKSVKEYTLSSKGQMFSYIQYGEVSQMFIFLWGAV